MVSVRHRGLADRARECARRGEWARAAALFGELARESDPPTAWQAWLQAADALRRDDRPAAAARALRAAADALGENAEAAPYVAVRCELAGVLVEAGEVPTAVEVAGEAVTRARGVASRALALDIQIGALVAAGLVAQAAGPLAELEALAAHTPIAAVSAAFWRATHHRLRGELERADHLYDSAARQLASRPQAAGAVAAAVGGRAELALLRRDGVTAGRLFDEAGRLWTAAGRRAGLYRAEAGLVRAALTRGETPLASALRGPVDYAREREMPLLEAELRVARGAAWARAGLNGAEADLDRAVALARRAGALLLEGRARAIRRRCGFIHDDLARIRVCLASDRPWSEALDAHLGLAPW